MLCIQFRFQSLTESLFTFVLSLVTLEGNDTVESGGTLRIECVASGFRPPIRFEWYHNSRFITEKMMKQKGYRVESRTDPRDERILVGELTVEDVTEEYAGMYYCLIHPYRSYKGLKVKIMERTG